MDYGQPLTNNDCCHCGGHGEPACMPEPQHTHQAASPLPEWMQGMLDQIPAEAYDVSPLQPVTNLGNMSNGTEVKMS